MLYDNSKEEEQVAATVMVTTTTMTTTKNFNNAAIKRVAAIVKKDNNDHCDYIYTKQSRLNWGDGQAMTNTTRCSSSETDTATAGLPTLQWSK